MFRRHESTTRGDRPEAETTQANRVELPRRVLDVPVAPSAHHGHGIAAPATGRVTVGGDEGPTLVQGGDGPLRPRASNGTQRQLVVGTEVALNGEIKGCERLVVDGELEATVASTEHLVVGADGNFRGTCEVETADIAGAFDGNLTVRGRLLVRASGRVKGEVRFGELEIERGGRLSGNVDIQAKGPQLATIAGGGD
jgi:cytoskeletal protein CcmA (bactofilin family)